MAPRYRRSAIGGVTFEHSRDVRDVKVATGDGQHELLGIIDGEHKIAVVQQAERAGGRPRQALVAVDERVVAGERVH